MANTLILVAFGFTVHIWDVGSAASYPPLVPQTLRQRVPFDVKGIWSIAFSADSKQLAAAHDDTTVRLWNLASRKETILAAHSHNVRSVVFMPDGRTLATGGLDGAVQLWDLKSLTIRKTLVGHQGGVKSVAASSNGKLLASSSSGHQVILWDIAAEPSVDAYPLKGARIIDFFVSPGDGPLVILEEGSGGERLVKFWDLRKNAMANVKLNLSGRPSQITMSRDGVLCVVCGNGRAHLWRVSDQTPRGVVPLGNIVPGPDATSLSTESSIGLSNNGTRLAAAEWDGAVAVWEIRPLGKVGLPKRVRSPSGRRIVSFAISSNGKTLATSDGSSVDLWNVDTGQYLRSLWDARGARRLAFSPDDSVLAAADQFAIRLWEMSAPDGTPPDVLPAHSTSISSLTFASDNRTVVTAANDGTIRLWDIPTRRQRFSLFAPDAGSWMRAKLTADQSALVAFGYTGLKTWRADGQGTAARSATVGRQRPAVYREPIDAIVESLALGHHANWLASAGKLREAETTYNQSLKLCPNDDITLRLRGNVRARAGRWAEALADYRRAIGRPGGYTAVRNHAALLLHAGDPDTYRQTCGELFDQFAESQAFDPTPCLIVPGAIKNIDGCVQTARLRAKQAKKGAEDRPSKLLTKALAEYRVAKFEQAMDDLTKMREEVGALGQPSMYRECCGCLLAAMASWQLNRKQAAREWLSKGQEIVQTELPKEGKDDIKLWRDWIHCQALLREAEELIGGTSAK